MSSINTEETSNFIYASLSYDKANGQHLTCPLLHKINIVLVQLCLYIHKTNWSRKVDRHSDNSYSLQSSKFTQNCILNTILKFTKLQVNPHPMWGLGVRFLKNGTLSKYAMAKHYGLKEDTGTWPHELSH